MPGFLTWMLFGQQPLLAQCVDLDVLLYYVADQKHLSTGVEMFHRPLLKAATHHRYIVPKRTAIRRYVQQSEPVQMAEVVLQVYVLVGEAWLYPSVNVANTVHLSNHHSCCLQSQNRGREDRPPERHLIADDRDK